MDVAPTKAIIHLISICHQLKGNTMATNINLQTEKPKIIELNFEDMKAEESY